MRSEIDDLQSNAEQLTKSKLNIERQTRNFEESTSEMRNKFEDNQKTLSELTNDKMKNDKDVADLKR